jgi:predicted AlkP superfamily pyrophosphatase or phosphodiesterase
MLLAAARDSGSFSETSFIAFGDHAYMDVHTCVRINAALKETGLLTFDAKGKLVSWKAWANCCEGSAQITLHDRRDSATRREVAEVFSGLQKGPRAVVETVYTREQVESMKVGERIDYILEAREGCYFAPEIEGPVISPGEETFRAVHGYHPDRPGYSSLFLAAGAGVRRGVEMGPIRIVDVGPTLAPLLGLNLPDAEGRVLTEILEGGT